MPQSRTPIRSHSTPNAPTTGESVAQGAPGSNTQLADILAGRTLLDGDIQRWFEQGITLQRGMRGPVIAQLQERIGAGNDGSFGPGTERALLAWQRQNGLPADGTVDAVDWQKIATIKPLVPNRPKGEEAFEQMWANHPHNYLPDSTQNTASADLNQELGFARDQFENTCALRMSTMLNRMGGEFRITREKALAAGLDKMRPSGMYLPKAKDPKTESEDDRVIVSAKEMWTYMEKTMGPPDLAWPPRGRNLKRADAAKAAEEAKTTVQGRKGFIAFDNLQLQDENGQYTGYGGSGHVDIFDGGQLSDGSFYPCQRILVWFVV